MRDCWVDELVNLFHKACNDNNNQININYLIEGLKNLFLNNLLYLLNVTIFILL